MECYNDYFALGSDSHRRSPSPDPTRSQEWIVSNRCDSIITSFEKESSNVTKWPHLSSMRMTTEFQINSDLSNFLDLFRHMIEEYWWRLFCISRKCANRLGNIFFHSCFWIVYTDDIDSLDMHDFITKYSNIRILKWLECSFYAEVCFMIPINIIDSVGWFDTKEWINQVLQFPIHPIEEISRNTDNLWMF